LVLPVEVTVCVTSVREVSSQGHEVTNRSISLSFIIEHFVVITMIYEAGALERGQRESIRTPNETNVFLRHQT